jgi:uncharacterized Zn finger protein (UPF0148 family)
MPHGFCQLCGKALNGRIHLLHHPIWPPGQELRICTDCFRQRPRCNLCGMPLAAMNSINGPIVCPTCQANVPRCLTCGLHVKGQVMVVDGIGPFCEQCVTTRPSCDICGAPLSDEHWQLSDGRLSCIRCHSTAVYTPTETVAIYEEVKQVVYKRFGLRLNIPTEIVLVDRNQLSQILLQYSELEEKLDPTFTLGVYLRKGMKRGIYIQSGLPANLVIRVTAHEYAHAWQGENCPLLNDPLLREGFAEWVAYRVLEFYRLDRQLEMMLKRCNRKGSSGDIYCQGLRMVLELENNFGAAGVINYCRDNRKISDQNSTLKYGTR